MTRPTINTTIFKLKVATFLSSGITKPKFYDGDVEFIQMKESGMMKWLTNNYECISGNDFIQFDLTKPLHETVNTK